MNMFILVTALLCISFCRGGTVEYVLEGGDVTLPCRLNRRISTNANMYWLGPRNGKYDNYAIDQNTFDNDYTIEIDRLGGRYDLTIRRATYDRNNGLFTCRIRDATREIHEEFLNLTVLIKPGSPQITPQRVTVTQDHPVDLTCSSKGGSPDPEIFWTRRSTGETVQSVLKPGGGRDSPTTSVLSLTPTKHDDGEEFLCEVRNRALTSQEKMVSSVTINVNYYPIVRITPPNPVRVIRGKDVHLMCEVDAKPAVQNVRWMRGGNFIDTSMSHTIRQVDTEDSGRYICQADNNLGRSGEAEVTVDVLYPPVVNVPPPRQFRIGTDVIVPCNVTSNPLANYIYWTKIGDPTFRQKNSFLRLKNISPNDHGDYVCHAISSLPPSKGEKMNLEGNATTSIQVEHSPGKSFILPSIPVGVEGKETILTCGSNPPGFPDTKYRWWRDDILVSIGKNYTIPITSKEHRGNYDCQPYNRFGNGTRVTVDLKVYQAPRITEGLTPTAVYNRERSDLKLSCRAIGNPKPDAKWYKDGKELKTSDGLYTIEVKETVLDQRTMEYVVQSTLSFKGSKRDEVGQRVLRPLDRGTYECAFKNDAQEVKSSQLLKVQHPPALAHTRARSAVDLGETAEIKCQMRAYPGPSFSWFFNNTGISSSSGGKYSQSEAPLGQELYESILSVRSVSEADYGSYTCKAQNSEGPTKTLILLEKKGLPEPPENFKAINVGVDFIEVQYTPGFDGGYPYEISYSVKLQTSEGRKKREKSVHCGKDTKCKIRNLDQNTVYTIKVYSNNPKGQSPFSLPIMEITSINPDLIPAPAQVYGELGSGSIVMTLPKLTDVGPSKLEHRLTGRIEISYEGPSSNQDWNQAPTVIPLQNGIGRYEMGSLSLSTKIRARFCIGDTQDICGPYTQATIVPAIPSHLTQNPNKAGSYLPMIVIIIICLIVLVVSGLFCCCYYKRRQDKKIKKKDVDSVANHIPGNTQAPPPYYTISQEHIGVENKGMLDSPLDDPKTALYGNKGPTPHQNHSNITHGQNYPNGMSTQGMPYTINIDANYANSNNGGSVNSQDSLWRNKGQGENLQEPNDYPYNQYNPVVHGGYGVPGYDDYAPYPHSNKAHSPIDDYSRGYNDQYSHSGVDTMEHSYDGTLQRGVSSPYLERGVNPHIDQQMSHMSPRMSHMNPHGNHVESYMNPHGKHMEPHRGFDETLESGISTPNSRNRRVIREIIV